MLKRVLATCLVAVGLAACGGYEAFDANELSNVPTSSLRFAATAGLGADLSISGSFHQTITTNPACNATFDGCYPVSNGMNAGVTDLCSGTYELGTAQLLDGYASCAGTPIATCNFATDATGATPTTTKTLAAGPNTIFIVCSSNDASATFDVTLN